MRQLTLLALLCSAYLSMAQLTPELSYKNNYPDKRLSVGLLLSDIAVQRFRIEGAYRIGGPHAIMLGVGTKLGFMDMDNRPFNERNYPANNVYTNLAYKYYVRTSENGNSFMFTKVQLAYQNTDVKYYEKDWVPEASGGLTYYYYRDVTKHYHTETLALGLEIGIELKARFFFTEFSFGGQYQGVISNDTPPDEFTEYSGGFFDDINYSGISPRATIKMGLYLD